MNAFLSGALIVLVIGLIALFAITLRTNKPANAIEVERMKANSKEMRP